MQTRLVWLMRLENALENPLSEAHNYLNLGKEDNLLKILVKTIAAKNSFVVQLC